MVGSTAEEMVSFLAKSNKATLDAGDYSDFVIICGGKKFKIHQAVICNKSTVLKKMCGDSFKEGNEGRATIKNIELEIFGEVLRYLYTAEYDNKPIINEQQRTDSLEVNVKVYIAGDYLDIMALKIAAIRNLDERASVPSPPAGFTAAVRETLLNTPHNDPELRTRVVSMYLENIELVEDETEKGALNSILHAHEPLAWKLLQRSDSNMKATLREASHQLTNLQKAQADISALEKKLEQEQNLSAHRAVLLDNANAELVKVNGKLETARLATAVRPAA